MASQPFDWYEYFKLAADLGKRTDEASLRSAISRAYYYVYHLALDRAQANAYKPLPGEATHTQLWRLFETNPESDCKRLAMIATRMKQKRERADYENHFVRIVEEVPVLLEDAQQFARLLAALPMRHPNPKSMRR